MIPKKVKKLKNNDSLNFEDVIDRGDLVMKVREQWHVAHTVRTVTNLALKHPHLQWRIFRIEEGSWYRFDNISEEWISEEENDG